MNTGEYRGPRSQDSVPMKEMTYRTYATLILTNASVTDVPSNHHYYNMSAKRNHADISWAEHTT